MTALGAIPVPGLPVAPKQVSCMSLGLARNHEKVVGWASVPAMILKCCIVRTLGNQTCRKEIGP
jgi:hypothetical protein